MNKSSSSNNLFSVKSISIAVIATVVYLSSSFLLIGFKTDQLFLAVLFNACYFFNQQSRRFILGFSIFIAYWIIFDYMKAIPNYRFNAVHITDLYNAEKSFFGIPVDGLLVTPNEYWLNNQSVYLDLLSGIFYLCWVPVPLAFALYLFFKNKKLFLHFSLTFVLVNLIGFVVYYIYPAAPPWYLQQQGSSFIATTPGNTAGLIRFDHLTGLSVFKNLYAKSSNVFAAMPSLHSSYPLIVLYFSFKKNVRIYMKLLFAIIMLGIWFAAVYTSHHYILDVMAGILCAVTGIVVFEKLLLKTAWVQRFLEKYLLKIS